MGIRGTEYKRICVGCGEGFTTRYSLKVYCARVCMARTWERRNPEKAVEYRLREARSAKERAPP